MCKISYSIERDVCFFPWEKEGRRRRKNFLVTLLDSIEKEKKNGECRIITLYRQNMNTDELVGQYKQEMDSNKFV